MFINSQYSNDENRILIHSINYYFFDSIFWKSEFYDLFNGLNNFIVSICITPQGKWGKTKF